MIGRLVYYLWKAKRQLIASAQQNGKQASWEQLIPTRGNLFLPVRLLVWSDGRGTVEQADSAARAELQGAPKQKLLQLKNITKVPLDQDREMLICCLDVFLPWYVNALAVSLCPQDLFSPFACTGRYRRMPGCRPGLSCRPRPFRTKKSYPPSVFWRIVSWIFTIRNIALFCGSDLDRIPL
jgi:hypothetical protein